MRLFADLKGMFCDVYEVQKRTWLPLQRYFRFYKTHLSEDITLSLRARARRRAMQSFFNNQ